MLPSHERTLRSFTGGLGIAVALELVLLRTGTRTLIHIPELGRYEVSIGILAEVGRLAFYTSLVLLIATLGFLAWSSWTTQEGPRRLIGGMVGAFLLVALLGRLGLVTASAVAWISLLVMVGVLLAGWGGTRSLPATFYVTAWAAASWSVLGQGAGGGLSGAQVDVAVVLAEALLILAGVFSPLLIRGRVSKPALVAGVVTVGLVAAGFSVGGSTLAILTLWNLGVPGWFAPLAWGLALGGLVVTLWSAIAHRLVPVACAVLLMVAGGVGPISTYQTALALTAVTLIALTPERVGLRAGQVVEPEVAGAGVVEMAGP